jgi:hypothetical protein
MTMWNIADPANPQRIWERNAPGFIEDMTISKDGARVLAAEQLDLVLREAAAGNEIFRFHGQGAIPPNYIDLSSNGRLALSLSQADNAIYVWRLPAAGALGTSPP